eukprot:SAG31_NODE_32186_length_359_cov_0.592308_1_plen_83_part_01
MYCIIMQTRLSILDPKATVSPGAHAAGGVGDGAGGGTGGGGAWRDRAAMRTESPDDVLINKMIPLLTMRNKVQRARLQQLLAL